MRIRVNILIVSFHVGSLTWRKSDFFWKKKSTEKLSRVLCVFVLEGSQGGFLLGRDAIPRGFEPRPFEFRASVEMCEN